jgi:hypothetical protein
MGEKAALAKKKDGARAFSINHIKNYFHCRWDDESRKIIAKQQAELILSQMQMAETQLYIPTCA